MKLIVEKYDSIPEVLAVMQAMGFDKPKTDAPASIGIADLSKLPATDPALLAQLAAAMPPPVIPPAALLLSPPPSGAVEFDSKGLPWDERLHSSKKTKNADGSFKRKKGVDDATFEKIAAELRARSGAQAVSPGANSAIPPPPPNLAPPPVLTVPHDPQAKAIADGWAVHPADGRYMYKGDVSEAIADVHARYPAPVIAPIAPPAPPAAPSLAAPAAGGVTWPMIAVLMEQKVNTVAEAVPKLTAIAGKYGLSQFAMFAGKPELFTAAYAELQAMV